MGCYDATVVPSSWRAVVQALAALSIPFCLGGCAALLNHAELSVLTTGPNGAETPEAAGVVFERLRIESGSRSLDAYLVRAPAECKRDVAILVFHGVKETISEWSRAQRFLHDHCVSSVVFDYSGHGDSSRPGTFSNLHEDAIATYGRFASAFPRTRRCVVGHSMGNGVMLQALSRFEPAPSCVVVASAFSSLRDLAARQGGMAAIASFTVADIWDNVTNVKLNTAPLLVIHSEADTVIPVEMGRRVFEAAQEPKSIVILKSFKHNAPYQQPDEAWWGPVLDFLAAAQ